MQNKPPARRIEGLGRATVQDSGRCLVLVVEDDPSIAEFVDSALGDEGYRVKVVATGEEALEAAAATPPDLILLDLRLPGISGAGFLQELRRREAKAAPVIQMTATRYGGGLEAMPATEGLLLKPFDLNDLLAETKRVLGERACAH